MEVSGLALVGAGIILAGDNKNNKNLGPEVVFIPVGGFVSLAGWIMTLTAHKHIRTARFMLQNSGIAVPIGRKK